MVKKPNGKYRFCLDFRKVNTVTLRNFTTLQGEQVALKSTKSSHRELAPASLERGKGGRVTYFCIVAAVCVLHTASHAVIVYIL